MRTVVTAGLISGLATFSIPRSCATTRAYARSSVAIGVVAIDANAARLSARNSLSRRQNSALSTPLKIVLGVEVEVDGAAVAWPPDEPQAPAIVRSTIVAATLANRDGVMFTLGTIGRRRRNVTARPLFALSVATQVRRALRFLAPGGPMPPPKTINGYKIEPHCVLPGAQLIGARLRGANMYGADLRGANLSDADLSFAYMPECNLTGANLTGANLTGANLKGARLERALLMGADLSESNLREADLTGARFYGTKLAGAKLCKTRMPDARLDNRDC